MGGASRSAAGRLQTRFSLLSCNRRRGGPDARRAASFAPCRRSPCGSLSLSLHRLDEAPSRPAVPDPRDRAVSRGPPSPPPRRRRIGNAVGTADRAARLCRAGDRRAARRRDDAAAGRRGCARGTAAWPWVVAIAALAGFAGDTLLFALGRWQSPRVFARWPMLAARVRSRIDGWLGRHAGLTVVGLRFA